MADRSDHGYFSRCLFDPAVLGTCSALQSSVTMYDRRITCESRVNPVACRHLTLGLYMGGLESDKSEQVEENYNDKQTFGAGG